MTTIPISTYENIRRIYLENVTEAERILTNAFVERWKEVPSTLWFFGWFGKPARTMTYEETVSRLNSDDDMGIPVFGRFYFMKKDFKLLRNKPERLDAFYNVAKVIDAQSFVIEGAELHQNLSFMDSGTKENSVNTIIKWATDGKSIEQFVGEK